MDLSTITKLITNALTKMQRPAEVLPPFLLYCTAMKRPGLSPSKITSQIISNNEALGIKTGPNEDGSPNVVNEYTYNVVKGIVDALKNEGAVQISVPVGAIPVMGTGANAGGPVVTNGYNSKNVILKGIIV